MRNVGQQAQLAGQQMGRFNMQSGATQNALRNLIFMVEDGASVFGTQGLTGVLRASSNNLTMMLAGLGPLAMGMGVAATSALQLYLALNKVGDSAEEAKKKTEAYRNSVKGAMNRVQRAISLSRELADVGTAEEAGKMLENSDKELQIAQTQLTLIEKQIATAHEKKTALEKRAAELGKQALSGQNTAEVAAANARAEAEKHQNRLNVLLEEGRDIAKEVSILEKENEKILAKKVDLTYDEMVAKAAAANEARMNAPIQGPSVPDGYTKDIKEMASNAAFLGAGPFEQSTSIATLEAKELAEATRKRREEEAKAAQEAERAKQIAQQQLEIERNRRSVMMSASQLVAQRQSSITVDRDAASKKSAMLAGMSKRDRMGYQIAERRAMESKNNNRGLFEDRKAKETERTNALLESMIRDGLKTKSGPATAG